MQEQSTIGASYPVDPYGEVASRCDLPSLERGHADEPQADPRQGREGHGRACLHSHLGPGPSAPAEGLERSAREDFPRTVEALEVAGVGELVRGVRGIRFSQPALRTQFARAYQGAKGLFAARLHSGGNRETHAAIFLGVLTYAHSPAVKQLEKMRGPPFRRSACSRPQRVATRSWWAQWLEN